MGVLFCLPDSHIAGSFISLGLWPSPPSFLPAAFSPTVSFLTQLEERLGEREFFSGEAQHVGFVTAAGCSEVLLAYSKIHSLAADSGGAGRGSLQSVTRVDIEQSCPWENAFPL